MARATGHREVVVPFDAGTLAGTLANEDDARKVVLFADADARREDARTRAVASALQRQGLATLVLDLRTAGDGGLARPLVAAIDWLASERGYVHGSIGCLGTGHGAAAALIAAAHRPGLVGALVLRSGEDELPGAQIMSAVRAPTLLIVGGDDPEGLAVQRSALRQLRCEADLRVVPGAGHLFNEPGALDPVAELTGEWFNHQLESIWSRSIDQPANL